MKENRSFAGRATVASIVLTGAAGLFFDMTRAGARSILGDCPGLADVSAAAIRFVSGLRELIAAPAPKLPASVPVPGIFIFLKDRRAAFPLQVPHDPGHTTLRLTQYLANPRPFPPVKRLSPVFRGRYNVVAAIPRGRGFYCILFA